MRFYRQNRLRILLFLLVQAAVTVSISAAHGLSETGRHTPAIQHARQAPDQLRLTRASQGGASRLNHHPTPSLPPQARPVFDLYPLSEGKCSVAARPLHRAGSRLRGRSPPSLL